ncbi:MAG: glycerophosphodiester phosphodiesterase [Candidatus Poseidoniia archaeon]
MGTKIISHRGRTSKNSEDNSLQAVEDAIDLGVDMIEVDIRRTKDSQIICFHDLEIGGILIANLNYSEIIDMNSQIPTLEQVLWLAKDKIEIDVELKESGYERDVITMVLDYFDYDSFTMKSFNLEVVKAIKEINQKIQTGMLLGSSYSFNQFSLIINESFTCSNFNETRADFISPYYKIFEAGWLLRFSKKQIPIQLWTVNDKELLRILINQEVHSIITDVPELALEVRKSISNV